MVVGRCAGQLPDGRQCRAWPLRDESFCLWHSPDKGCPGYQRPSHPAADLTVDHVVPLAAGGAPFDIANCAVLCRSRNSTKGASEADRGSPHEDPAVLALPTGGRGGRGPAPWGSAPTSGEDPRGRLAQVGGASSSLESSSTRFPSGSATNAILSPGSGVSRGVQTERPPASTARAWAASRSSTVQAVWGMPARSAAIGSSQAEG